jgi:hypothetical protein
MSRPIAVTVGGLVAASATRIGLSQLAAIAGTNYLVLNGAAGAFSATSIAASQSPGGAGALTLDGSLVRTVSGAAIAYLPPASRIYITSAGNDSGRSFVVRGQRFTPGGLLYGVTETITGANTSTVSSQLQYDQIISITVDAATAAAITVGHYGTATNDVARQVILTSGGNDTGDIFTITGTDWANTPITEQLAGASGAAATSLLSYKTIESISSNGALATTVTIGTNTVADSPWIMFDPYAGTAPISLQVTVSGTVNYTVYQTLDNPTALDNLAIYNRPDLVTWVAHPDSALAGATATAQGNYAYLPAFCKVRLNSGSGSVTLTAIQAGIFR